MMKVMYVMLFIAFLGISERAFALEALAHDPGRGKSLKAAGVQQAVPDDVVAGKKLFQENCQSCHGTVELYARGKKGFSALSVTHAPHGDTTRVSSNMTDENKALIAKAVKYSALDYSRDLKPLVMGSSLQVNTGSGTSIAPSLEGAGDIFAKELGGNMLLTNQIRLQLRPDPSAGTKDQVAQQIRTDIGTMSTNYSWKFSNVNYDDGPFGVDLKLGGHVGYQRSPSPSGAGQAATTVNEFGTAAVEGTVGCWLKYLYAGYKYSKNFTFGTKSEISDEINNTDAHKILFVFKIDSLSGSKDEVELGLTRESNPFYLEFQYTGGKNKLNDGTFTASMTKAFNWAW